MQSCKHLLVIAAGLAMVAPGLAQETAPAPTLAPAPAAETPGRPNRADVIKQFDQNGDGVLDETERQAARGALNARSPRRTAGQTNASSPSAAELMRRFDQNGDGKIDDGEREAARAEASRNRPAAAATARPQIDRQAMVKEFDKDGDGKLNDSERAAATQAVRERIQKAGGTNAQSRPVRPELLKRFDANGDGVLDDAERQAARDSVLRKDAETPDPAATTKAPGAAAEPKTTPPAKKD